MNKTLKSMGYNTLTKEEDLEQIVYPYVKQYLIDNDIEIRELAEKSCMTISNLRKYLRDQTNCPRISTLKKMMKATNLTMSQLLYKK